MCGEECDSETIDKVIDKSRAELSEVYIRIMEEMRHNPGITQPQLAEKTRRRENNNYTK